MKIISVVGARPNFMKIAPFIRAINTYNKTTNHKIEHMLVHTGQHYDDSMSQTFFNDLGIPEAEINLGVGSGTHAEQVGQTMIAFEKVLRVEKPEWVVVVGDVNATLACSVTAKKEHIKCCHIEAGLRSHDWDMPEEINRLVTDRLSDLLLTPDPLSSENLRKEGREENQIIFVGNIMIDTLEANRHKAEKLTLKDILREHIIEPKQLSVFDLNTRIAAITLHRPSNVDHKAILGPLINFISSEVTQTHSIIWPVHPRAKKMLMELNLWDKLISNNRIFLTEPLGYHAMLKLNMQASIILTDSGGLQEECTILGTPCLTLRWNTERPITLKEHGGVSILVGNNIERIRKEYKELLLEKSQPKRPELWDGHTAERVLKAILEFE